MTIHFIMIMMQLFFIHYDSTKINNPVLFESTIHAGCMNDQAVLMFYTFNDCFKHQMVTPKETIKSVVYGINLFFCCVDDQFLAYSHCTTSSATKSHGPQSHGLHSWLGGFLELFCLERYLTCKQALPKCRFNFIRFTCMGTENRFGATPTAGFASLN